NSCLTATVAQAVEVDLPLTFRSAGLAFAQVSDQSVALEVVEGFVDPARGHARGVGHFWHSHPDTTIRVGDVEQVQQHELGAGGGVGPQDVRGHRIGARVHGSFSEGVDVGVYRH